MSIDPRIVRRIASAGVAFGLFAGLFLTGVSGVSAHARYDHSVPDVSAPLDGSPLVLRTYYTQELMSASTVQVLDVAGNQVDLGDGRVDLDDPDRKAMTVSLPALPMGLYTVQWSTVSAEDGDAETGAFIIGVGMGPSGSIPAEDTLGAGSS
jgi:methionine-rich copper-binding protein CopC